VTPASSRQAFEQFLANRGAVVESLTVGAGARYMSAFYATMPADSVQAESGDMLLFQYGTFDWGNGQHFEVDFTRQFIDSSSFDDDSTTQLHLTYRFHSSTGRNALGSGSEWCKAVSSVDSFNRYLQSHPVVSALRDAVPSEVELRYEQV
jgi:hypothetical protein